MERERKGREEEEGGREGEGEGEMEGNVRGNQIFFYFLVVF